MTAAEKRRQYKLGLRAGFCRGGMAEQHVDCPWYRSGYERGERLWRAESELVVLDDPVPHTPGGHAL